LMLKLAEGVVQAHGPPHRLVHRVLQHHL
jgi:hypothetical protein